MKQRILITGSSGMLGIDLSRELKSDYEVIGLDMVRHPNSKVRKFFIGDITDREALAAIIMKASPDVVIHCAAWTDVDGCQLDSRKAYKINSTGTRNIALACKKTGVTLIYISTDFVFSGRKLRPYVETDKTGPLSVYGDSKLKGEAFVRKTLDRYFILRTSWLYGKHGKNFVDTIAAKAKSERSLKVVMDQAGSPTYTKHLAKAIHMLLCKAAGRSPLPAENFGIYHISNSGAVSWYDYAIKILKLAGSNTIVVPITSGELSRPAKRPAMSVMDNSKFRKFTGYRMPGWKIGLKEYLAK